MTGEPAMATGAARAAAEVPPAKSPEREIELRLILAPGDLARLAREPALVGPAEEGARTDRVLTTYFDTDDLALAAHGLALRVRRQGRSIVQSVKTMDRTGEGAAALAVRREWEWPLRSGKPDPALLVRDGVADLLPPGALDRLRPLFATDFQRTSFVIRPDPLTIVEVSLDDGEIRAGGAHRPICELELELRSGRIDALFDLARDLHRRVPLRIAVESKAAAGFALLAGKAPAAVQPDPGALTPVATAAEGFRHVMRSGIAHMLANGPAVLAGTDAEAIHQMRAAARRLRAHLTLFAPLLAHEESARHRDELGWLARRLGSARHWDVLRDRTLAAFCERHGPGLGVIPLRAAIEECGRAARARAVEALRAPRATALLLDLAGWVESGRWHGGEPGAAQARRPLLEMAPLWLGELHRKVRKAGRGLDRLDDEDRRRLRQRVERLRHAAEILRGLYPPGAARPYLEPLQRLHERLGELDDLAMARRMIAEVTEGADRPVHGLAREIDAWLDRRIRKRAAMLAADWAAHLKADPFWV